MNRLRSQDVQAVIEWPPASPAEDAPVAGLVAPSTPTAVSSRARGDVSPAAATPTRRRMLFALTVTAALAVLAVDLPVAEDMPPVTPPSSAPAAPGTAGIASAVVSDRAAPKASDAPLHRRQQLDAGGDAPGTPPAADSLRLVPSQATPNPLLVRAFDALHADQLAAAEVDYASVLAVEPHNTDALLGMAAIALRRGRTAAAETMFRRAIEADPMNVVAQAGLLGAQPLAHAADVESQLKGFIAAQPDEHPLRFALGNVFAASERWQEAQQEYFHAHAGDPQQPDYLFNLAVSLDRLHQHQLAADYYAAALAAAARRPAQFEPALASTRRAELTE